MGVRVVRSFNRGIVVGSVYVTSMVLALLYLAPGSMKEALQRELGVQLAVVGMLGLVAGAIGGFSNTIDGESGRRDLKRNASDGVMIVLWTANGLLAANLALRFVPAPTLLRWIGALAAGVALGAIVGEPLLRILVRVRVRGRQPLLWVNTVTEHIRNPDIRFVVRVLVQTLVVGLLLVLAFVMAIIVIAVVVLAVIALVISIVSGEGVGGGSRRASAGGSSSDDREDDRELLHLPAGSKILPDGRIVQEGLLFDKDTGMRINEDGQVVEEGLLFDRATGVKIDDDGRIVEEGVLFDRATGARLVDGELVEEGLLFDKRTGVGIDGDGRVVEKGVFFDEKAGVVVTAGGKIRRTDGDSDE